MDQNSPSESSNTQPLKAAVYARMSTDHQQYSTHNQISVITKDAEKRGLQIVKYFVDEGKSGLKIAGRKQMQKMVDEACEINPEFDVIMVYDITRWGRFQEADESGYYEWLCAKNGIKVIYCAEDFENDGTPVATLLKANKRFMSGEFGSKLSRRVFCKGRLKIAAGGGRIERHLG